MRRAGGRPAVRGGQLGTGIVPLPVTLPVLPASPQLAALRLDAGRAGPWYTARTNPEDAAQARGTTDQLAAILLGEQHAPDQ